MRGGNVTCNCCEAVYRVSVGIESNQQGHNPLVQDHGLCGCISVGKLLRVDGEPPSESKVTVARSEAPTWRTSTVLVAGMVVG